MRDLSTRRVTDVVLRLVNAQFILQIYTLRSLSDDGIPRSGNFKSP